MTTSNTVYAGTAGQGVWRSTDTGETFHRRCAGMFMESVVRALAVHPHDPDILFAGTDSGLYRTTNGGDRWTRIETPFDNGSGWPCGVAVWSVLIHPQNPDLMFIGTCPPAVYRSRDAGNSWETLNPAFAWECAPIVYSRVTCLKADPDIHRRIWCGVEIDGVWRSDDEGDNWIKLGDGLSSPDIHDLAILPGSGHVLAATNNDLNISYYNGKAWQPQGVKDKFPFAYCRALKAKSDDPRTLFLGNGNGPPGTAGALQVSHDGGEVWRQADLGEPAPNSTIWTVATDPDSPNLIYCAAINGYLYRSGDGGETWRKCAHEFGEVRCLALTTSSSNEGEVTVE